MSSLKDALGFEENLPSGLAATNQGYFTGSVTAESYFSGLNAFIAGSVQCDKVLGDVQVTGLNIFATSGVTARTLDASVNISGTGSVFGGVIAEGGTHRPPRTAPGAGSPTSFAQQMIFTGSGATDGGSKAWIVFSTAYTAAPEVLVTPGSGALGTSFGLIAIDNGSFGVESSTASKNFQWYSFGAP